MGSDTGNNNLLVVENLKTYFPVKKGLMQKTVGHVKAVDDVSFSVRRGQTVGLVGESGCGKTTAARTVLKLIPATSGKIIYNDLDVLKADKKQLKKLHREATLVFQDPYSSLNPRMTVGNIIGEPVRVHEGLTGKDLAERVAIVLDRVGLSPDYVNRYPHEFSGGQRQRIGVARALVLNPKLVICDEPVSALDVSIQSQILNLLKDLQDEFGLTYLFIAHDLAVVEFFCDMIAVMYLGKIVEKAAGSDLYSNPMHPYTRALMSAIPHMDTNRRGMSTATGGEVPSPLNPPSGCPFHPRCKLAEDICSREMPKFEQKGDNDHFAACWKC